MIVVDTSALIAIVLKQPHADACRRALSADDDVVISAGSLAETHIVATGRKVVPALEELLERLGLLVAPVDEETARAVGIAYERYGKGFHAASLNYGDCFAYVLARELDLPLLFVGRDFSLTDVKKIDATMGSA